MLSTSFHSGFFDPEGRGDVYLQNVSWLSMLKYGRAYRGLCVTSCEEGGATLLDNLQL
jgi:hypothetical protein